MLVFLLPRCGSRCGDWLTLVETPWLGGSSDLRASVYETEGHRFESCLAHHESPVGEGVLVV